MLDVARHCGIPARGNARGIEMVAHRRDDSHRSVGKSIEDRLENSELVHRRRPHRDAHEWVVAARRRMPLIRRLDGFELRADVSNVAWQHIERNIDLLRTHDENALAAIE